MNASSIGLRPSPTISHVEILGVDVSTVSMDSAVAAIEQWIADKTPNYVCVTGAHGIIESRRDPRLCDIHNAAGMVTPDGMPLVVMLRMLGFKFVTRVYDPDLMQRLSQISAQRGYHQFYYGGGPGVANRLAGAAFDFLIGTKRQAPRWMQRSSLEWAYRLASEPRRLWRRYAQVVPMFALLATRQLIIRALSGGRGNKVTVAK
jgi:UDP-N-acetyl-D-mannosaminuronic acid transferase (WecB/TagA/CpsF family)